MPDDIAPTPWTYDGVQIIDANGALVAIVAQRLYTHPDVVAKLTVAPEMYETLRRVGPVLDMLPATALTYEVQSLVKVGRPTTATAHERVVEPPDKPN